MSAPDQIAENERKPRKDPTSMRRRWMGRLKREEDARKEYRKQGMRAMREYQNKREDQKPVLYPIFWANTKITHSAIFNRQPKPEVRRRNGDAGGDKQIALAMERCLSYQMDTTSFDDHSNRAVNEYLVTASGVDRLYLKAKTADIPVLHPMTGAPIEDPDNPGQQLTETRVIAQYVCLEYVPWDSFHWEPQKDWEECDWIAFDLSMSGAQIKREYGVDVADSVGESVASDDTKIKLRANKYTQHYVVREVWDRKTRTIITFCEAIPELWIEKADELHLEGFYPCARPMFMDLLSGELMPVPEFDKIAPMCDEINVLTGRIMGIVKSVKDIGVYDASFGDELAQMMGNDDGARIPVVSLLAKLKDTSFSNVVITETNVDRVNTITALRAERESQKVELYEITGISDIVRGASQASETATAQQLKGQWANVRLSDKMREVSNHYRAVFRLMAELIAEHFQPEQIMQQSGVELSEEQIASMKSDLSRSYAIDIETDSTIAQDEAQDKADRMEFYAAFTQAMGTVMPMVQAGVMPADLANATLLFVVRSFRHGRQLEEAVEAMPGTKEQLDGLTQQLQQAQQGAEQMQARIAELEKALADAQNATAAQRAQTDAMKAQADAVKAATEAQRTQIDGVGTAASAGLDRARTAEIEGRMQREESVATELGFGADPFAGRPRARQ